MEDYRTSSRRLRRAARYRASNIILSMMAGTGLVVLLVALIALALGAR